MDAGSDSGARRVGVVGSGTLAEGIAEACAAAGVEARMAATGSTDGLAGCELVVDVAAGALEDRRSRLSELSALLPQAVLAVGTPELPVTALAGAAADPGRVVGLRFFAPVPLVGIAELVAGVRTSPAALALARGTAVALGARVVEAGDGPGFLADRCERPLAAEALRLLADGIAHVEVLDRIVRAAGFPVGPFEQQDLLGLDTALAAAEEAHARSYGEPRLRPSPLLARLVEAGRLGSRTGRGWYPWAAGAPVRADDPPLPEPGGGARRLVLLTGDTMLAHELRGLADEADWRVADEPDGEVPWLVVAAGLEGEPDGAPLQGGPQVLLCAGSPLHDLDPGGSAAGFHALPPLADGGLVELTRGTGTSELAAERAEAFFTSLGLGTAWVGDAPGLALGRIACRLVDEAALALADGAGADPEALDELLELGLAHPRGPLAWGDEIGLDHVLAVLDGLRAWTGEERYRAAPLLRRMVADGHVGMAADQGFHAYEEPEPHVAGPRGD